MKNLEHWVSISGGKDSTATACLAIERAERRGMNLRFVFADTGNEHSATTDYVGYLGHALGVKIETVRADFSEKLAKHRAHLKAEWGKEKRRTKHIHGCDRRGCDCPVTISPAVPADLIERAASMMEPTGNPFLDLCILKGRFPSRTAQFCTEELKLAPIAALKNPLFDKGVSIITWIGERAAESPGRAAKPQIQSTLMRIQNRAREILYRPIKFWSAADTFAIADRHGLKPNPLYLQGMNRVGCLPCINCSKGELASIASRFPEHIDRIALWEELVAECSRRGAATFFYGRNGKVPGGVASLNNTEIMAVASIRNSVDWARTSRGGRQYDLLIEAERKDAAERGHMCESAYGLCE